MVNKSKNIEFGKVIDRAMEVRRKYAELEKKKYGKQWKVPELMQGFMGDVGDLAKLVTAKQGLREIDNVDEKIKHELADCLRSVIVLANEYNIDIEKVFLKTMDELDTRIKTGNTSNKRQN